MQVPPSPAALQADSQRTPRHNRQTPRKFTTPAPHSSCSLPSASLHASGGKRLGCSHAHALAWVYGCCCSSIHTHSPTCTCHRCCTWTSSPAPSQPGLWQPTPPLSHPHAAPSAAGHTHTIHTGHTHNTQNTQPHGTQRLKYRNVDPVMFFEHAVFTCYSCHVGSLPRSASSTIRTAVLRNPYCPPQHRQPLPGSYPTDNMRGCASSAAGFESRLL